MISFMRGAIDYAQKALGRSRLAVQLAIKIKNQCDLVLGARFGGSHLFADSGEEWLARLIAPRSSFFVDVGANVGEWSVMFAAQMVRPPAGVLFEPHPGTAIRLRAVMQEAGLAGCDVIEAAATDRSGTAPFFAEPNYGHTSSLHALRHRRSADTINVRLCRLDDELSQRRIADIDVLKVDAEGHDFFVLLGAETYLAARRIKLVQFEYNAFWIEAGATLTRAVAHLAAHGYVVRLLRADGLYELDVGRCGEFFKYSNFVAYLPGAFDGTLDRLPCRLAI